MNKSLHHSEHEESAVNNTVDSTISIIRDAAQRCFLRKGFKETTIRDIASAAGVSPATIYLYFENKAHLFESLEIPEALEINPEHERLQAEITRVALFLFSSKGFQKTSMKDVADAAKISKATLYKYCTSKEDLLGKVLQASAFNVTVRQSKPKEKSWRENVKHFGSVYLMLTHEPERMALLRCVVSESHNFPEIGQMYYEKGFMAACQNVVEYLQQLIDESKIQLRDGFDLSTAVHTYFGSLQSFLLMSSVVPSENFRVNAEDYLNITTEVFLNGIFVEN